MPNHVANKVTFIGSDAEVAKILEFIKGENGAFDFDKIVPMPQTYKLYDTTNHPDGRGLTIGKPIRWDEDSPVVTEKTIEDYKKATAEQRNKYGVVGWLDWCRQNWGTKWDAYDICEDGNTISFSTAWCAPYPVIRKLSDLFPSIKIVHVWADEDWGYNCGRDVLRDGEYASQYCPEETSDDAMALYFETHPDEEELFEKVDGKWRYVEE